MKRFVSIIVALLCLHGAIAQDVRMSEMLHGSVCFSPDGKNILTSSGQLIDLKTGKVALNLNYNGTDQNGDPTFFEAAFSPKGKYILYNRQIFDGQTAKNIITLPPKESAARNYPDSEKHFFQLKNLETASFSADESKVLAGDQLFDVKSGKLLTTLKPKAYKSGPAFITFSGNTYRSIINTVSISTELGDFSSNYNDAVSPNLKYYLSAESLKDESISFFDIVQKSARENYDEKEDLLSLWYEMDGKKTGSDRLSNRFEEDKAHFSLDGQRVVIIDGKSAKIFNMKNGKLISKIDGSDDWENGYLSPSGKLVFLYEYLQMEIYEVDTKKKLCVLYGDGAVDTESREPSFSVSNPIFSPNDKYFINGADGQIWDVKTGAKLGKLPLYNFKMDAISAQIGDNQRIAIQYRDGSSRLFDTVSGEELFTNITQNVNTMLFTVSRDCKWAAATDWNGNLSVWDISSPTPIKSWEAHGGALLTQIVFDTAENTLITYGIDQKIKTWNLPLLTETNIITAEKPFSQIFLEGTDLLGFEGFTVNLIDKKTGKNINECSLTFTYELPDFSIDAKSKMIFSGSTLYNYENGALVHDMSIQRTEGVSWDKIVYLGSNPEIKDEIYTISSESKVFLWNLSQGVVKNNPLRLTSPQELVSSYGFDRPHVALSPSMVLAYSGSVYNFVNKTYQFALKSAISSVGFSGSSMQDEFTISSDLSKIAIFYFLQPKDVNRTLRIFDTKTNAKICDAKLGKYVNAVRCVYSPNADQIYVGLYDRESYTKSVGLVDTKTGDLLKKSVDIPFEVDEMIIAPNGNWLAVCDWDKLIVFDKTLSTILYDIKLPFNAADFHLTVSPDSRYLSATSQNGFKGGNSVIIDTQTGVVTPLQGLAYYVAFTGDSKFVLATLKDTKANADFMTMWKLPDLKEKTATFLQLGIGTKSIIYTPDQYYMATKDAVKDVHFSKGKKTYLFDQFDLRFNRPDIILNRLGYATPEMVSAYKRAWEKRVKKMGFDPSLFDGIELKINTPEVALESQLPTTTQTPWANLEIRATDELYPIERIQIYQNGVPIFGRKGIDVKQQNVKKGTINEVFSTQKIELLQGKNVIEISAINTQGIESVRERHQLTFTRQKPLKPKLLVIAIGVSEFKNTEMNLTYAAKDADDLAALFKTKTDLYSEIEVLKFTNQNALRDSILKCKSNLLRTKVEDEVILFVASHGLLDSQLDYYIATHDVNFENPALQGLKYEDLENLLDGIPARKKIMLIDACHSGEVDKEESVLVDADTKVKVEGVTGRGFKSLKSKSLGLDNSFELMKELFTDIRRGTGAVVISSASGKEYAFESAAWKNGVFTYSLLEGLKSGNADLGQDSRISISEIRDYVSKKVEELTDGKQHPTSRSENLEVDFNIW